MLSLESSTIHTRETSVSVTSEADVTNSANAIANVAIAGVDAISDAFAIAIVDDIAGVDDIAHADALLSVPRVAADALTYDQFFRRYMEANMPCILTG